jgi:transcription-repair coupling factor (superfamily II helicase)
VNRFRPAKERKQVLQRVADGQVQVIVVTHQLLSKDVEFHDLGLLVIDEEQRFGVTHKEKIRKLKNSIDTIAMSATPIPRTLNLSLVGIRDLSLINTAPVDRVPSRTLICKFEKSTIRKAIMSEINRGGQIYFIHNRIHSIYALAEELKALVPEARIKIGHGQQPEDELEKTMLAFFNH